MNAGARLEGTWEAMAGVMDVLRADLVCTPGLRFPAVFARDSPVPPSAEGLPEAYGYLYAGFRRATYDGVGWLHRPGRTVALAPETEERIVVVEAGGGAFVAKHGDAPPNFPGTLDLMLTAAAHTIQSSERFLQTGTGWLLREISVADRRRINDFIGAHIKHFTREGLQYTVEKFPKTAKQKALTHWKKAQ